MKNIKKTIESNEILSNLFYVLTGVLLAFAIYQGIGFALNTDDPIVTVVSYSMKPALERGDMLILRGVPVSELTAGRDGGDIIVYEYGEKLIVHRVYKINDDGTFRTWGDYNAGPDPWDVQPSWIKGKMIYRVPYLGYPRIILSELIRK